MYNAFETNLRFALHHGLPNTVQSAMRQNQNWDPDLNDAILAEAAKFATNILAPLNYSGDQSGCKIDDNHHVSTPDGYIAAHRAMVAGGWHGIEAGEEFGGQNLPKPLAAAISEMFYGANMALTLCQLLNMGQIHALELYGTPEQQATYLPKLISGEWVGNMNLTEAHAGTDLGALRTRAQPKQDHYLIYGQKIYITYGEHDLTENISNLVLARIDGAPEGHQGLSLFIVPKFLPNADGTPGQRNDVKCVSIEHKLGINGSPTAVLQYGDNGGAVGFLVGQENQGLKMMFAMMNHARFAVGVQGVGLSSRAFAQAQAYANERVQGTPLGRNAGDPIAHHPDVGRLLGSMGAQVAANRALMLYTAAMIDQAQRDADMEPYAQLLIPIFKGYATECAVHIASDGVQVHGGMGFVEETGAAQHYRDARILPIYEGTTAIQANDLVFRKTLRDQGNTVASLLANIRADAGDEHSALTTACTAAQDALSAILSHSAQNPRHGAAVGVPFLMMLGSLTAGWLLDQSAKNAAALPNNVGFDANFINNHIALNEIFATHHLPDVYKYAQIVINGAQSVDQLLIP